jgi:hypothetical protein
MCGAFALVRDMLAQDSGYRPAHPYLAVPTCGVAQVTLWPEHFGARHGDWF